MVISSIFKRVVSQHAHGEPLQSSVSSLLRSENAQLKEIFHLIESPHTILHAKTSLSAQLQ